MTRSPDRSDHRRHSRGDHSVSPHADAKFGQFIAVSGMRKAEMKDVGIVQLDHLRDPDAILQGMEARAADEEQIARLRFALQ